MEFDSAREEFYSGFLLSSETSLIFFRDELRNVDGRACIARAFFDDL